MGPANNSEMTESHNNHQSFLSLPKLSPDSSNWSTYQECILNAITSKGLKRHVLGTARKPIELVERNGDYYKPSSLSPLSDEEIEKHEESQDLYDQNQATVREIIYCTVDKSTFLQIKGQKSADLVWKKLISIHADKGGMYETDLLTRLQNARYTEGDNMREHLSTMTELKEHLAEMNMNISDESFVAYIQTSLSLTPTYRPLIITLSVTARKSGKPITSSELIWHLTEEAASTLIEDNINKLNAAMFSQHKGKGKGRGNSSKPKSDRYCTNCKKEGHTKDQCWEKGGGKAGKAPSW
jgi:hypothetical protein